MILKTIIKKFTADETGAISMEIIALGAAVGFAAIFATVSVIDGVEKLDEDRGYQLRHQEKVTTF